MGSGVDGKRSGEDGLEVVVRADEGRDEVVLVLAGELDAATAPRVRSIIDKQTHPVAFDLHALAFCDSSGLACFIAAYQRYGSCRIVGASEMVRQLLEITGLLARFDVS